MITFALQDASILIDLLKIDLLQHCFRLNFRFCTTDIIFFELHQHQQNELQKYINDTSFEIIIITPDELTWIAEQAEADGHLSPEDFSAFYFAQKRNALLMTGDHRLRKLAEEKNVQVCGILRIFDELVSNNIITPLEAVNFMHVLLKQNKRLPLSDCHDRIKKWSAI